MIKTNIADAHIIVDDKLICQLSGVFDIADCLPIRNQEHTGQRNVQDEGEQQVQRDSEDTPRIGVECPLSHEGQ